VNSDTIQLRDLKVDCIIGVNDAERHEPQPLLVHVELLVNTESAASSDRLEETVDYENIAAQILFILRLGQFHLLETACHALCRTLLLPPAEAERRAAIESVRLRIEKPQGLRGQAIPCLEVSRHRRDMSYRVRERSFGNLHIVHETPNIGIYRLNLAPGQRVPLHMHPMLQEAEMLLSDGILVQNVAGSRGSIRVWPKSFPHSYENPTVETQGILCLCRPAYSEAGEVLVQGHASPIDAYTPSDLDSQQLTRDWLGF